MTATVRITAFTHRGRVRARNEDTVVVGDWVSEPEMAAPLTLRHGLEAPLLCAVADGMGGHRGGAVASRFAAERLAALAAQLADARSVIEALRSIDAGLHEAMRERPDVLGMGTTVVGLVLGARALWFNVGDSRLYRWAGGALTQLSIDDSPPGPRSGLLTQALGGAWPPAAITPHVGETTLAAPSRYLLCSDGLTDMLDDAEIAQCLALSDADAVAALFERAMAAGGRDNVSIVLAGLDAT